MSNKKIVSALQAKGYKEVEATWEPITYKGRDGREGGWTVTFDEDLPDGVYDIIWNNMPYMQSAPNGDVGAIVQDVGLILGFHCKYILSLISELPDVTKAIPAIVAKENTIKIMEHILYLHNGYSKDEIRIKNMGAECEGDELFTEIEKILLQIQVP